MAIYVDSDALKKALTLEGTRFADEYLEASILAASAGIEMEQGRSYGLSEEDETRLFSPTLSSELVIDDLSSITRLRVDASGRGDWEEWAVDVDFRLEPLNAPDKGRPWTLVRATGKQLPMTPLALVEIEGKWGWPSPPFQILEAADLITRTLVKRKQDAPLGFQLTAESAAYIARTDPHVKFLLKGLGRRTTGAGSLAMR